jgi:aminoglycoside phosphotransferase (APT) family kinase protein
VYGFEPDPGVLGAPFFVMERIVGLVPADQPPWASEGFVHDAGPAQRRAMWDDAVRVLAALHQTDDAIVPFLLPSPGQSGLEQHLQY